MKKTIIVSVVTTMLAVSGCGSTRTPSTPSLNTPTTSPTTQKITESKHSLTTTPPTKLYSTFSTMTSTVTPPTLSTVTPPVQPTNTVKSMTAATIKAETLREKKIEAAKKKAEHEANIKEAKEKLASQQAKIAAAKKHEKENIQQRETAKKKAEKHAEMAAAKKAAAVKNTTTGEAPSSSTVKHSSNLGTSQSVESSSQHTSSLTTTTRRKNVKKTKNSFSTIVNGPRGSVVNTGKLSSHLRATNITISKIGMNRGIYSMGLTSRGLLDPRASRVNWYNKTAVPGQPGISVLLGHSTWNFVPNVFYRLPSLSIGDHITITYNNGAKRTFTVYAKDSVNKTVLTKDQRIWGKSSTPIIALVTCDTTSRLRGVHRVNNLVVWAK